MVSNSTLLVKTKLSSPVLENRDIRVMACVTGAKRRQLTETAVRYSKVAMAVLYLLHEISNIKILARLWKLVHPFLPPLQCGSEIVDLLLSVFIRNTLTAGSAT